MTDKQLEALLQQLEQAVDRSSIGYVLAALADVASAKSEHVQVNWQDEALAKQWRRLAMAIQQLSVRITQTGDLP